MIIAFHPQFVQKILARTKIHTIRADQSDRWHYGLKMHMATGVRTKSYYCFNDQYVCTGTQQVRIDAKCHQIFVDDEILNNDKTALLIRNDGFDDSDDFWEWFKDVDSTMKLIHWTDFRY